MFATLGQDRTNSVYWIFLQSQREVTGTLLSLSCFLYPITYFSHLSYDQFMWPLNIHMMNNLKSLQIKLKKLIVIFISISHLFLQSFFFFFFGSTQKHCGPNNCSSFQKEGFNHLNLFWSFYMCWIEKDGILYTLTFSVQNFMIKLELSLGNPISRIISSKYID